MELKELNSFDEEQINILQPLLDNKVVLHYPFYPNTFPLAFHYYQGLKKNGGKGFENKIKENLLFHIWSEDFPSKSKSYKFDFYKKEKLNWLEPKAINIFYSNQIELHKFKEEIQNDFKGEEELESLFFSDYVNNFFFIDYSLWSSMNLYHKRDKFDDFIKSDRSSFKNHFETLTTFFEKTDVFKTITVYTDLPNEARELFSKAIKGKHLKLHIQEQSRLNFFGQESLYNLNIYFYGAATTFFYLHKNEKYIPIFIDTEKISIATGIICIHYNKNKIEKLNDKKGTNNIQNISSALDIYHKNIFQTAQDDQKFHKLNNIRLAYNKLSRLLGHPSYFYDIKSYASCLKIHHNPIEILPKEESLAKDKPNTQERKINHVHFGAGKLGLGLVLPLINNSENVTTILFQKNKDDSKYFTEIDWNTVKKRKQISINSTNVVENQNKESWKKEFGVIAELNESTQSVFFDNYLIFFGNYQTILPILTNADIITFSFNNLSLQEELIAFLKNNKNSFNKTTYILPFENELKTEQNFDCENLKYRQAKADRICNSRIYDNDTILVKSEQYYELVVSANDLKDTESINCLFNNTIPKENLIVCNTPEKYEFYSLRKKYFVNELHFLIAIYGYSFLKSKKISNWKNQYIPIIQSALNESPDYRIPIATFIKLQIQRILIKCSDFIKQENSENSISDNVELKVDSLLKYAKQAIERFKDSADDPLDRIFKMVVNVNENNKLEIPDSEKVKNKYEKNYKHIKNYFDNINIENDIVFHDKISIIERDAFFENYKKTIDAVLTTSIETAITTSKDIEKKMEKDLEVLKEETNKKIDTLTTYNETILGLIS